MLYRRLELREKKFTVDWHDFYELKFGVRWYFTELLYRIVDVRVLINFGSILGVGSGRAFTENLLSKDRYVIASDRNAALVRIAKKHAGNVGFLACDGFKLPFKNQSFECVYSQGLLEHFDVSSTEKLLREMERVGEVVVFSVPLEGYDAPVLGMEFRRKTQEWRKIISNIFTFTDAELYFYKREGVFIASNRPLRKRKRFATIRALKKILLSSKPLD